MESILDGFHKIISNKSAFYDIIIDNKMSLSIKYKHPIKFSIEENRDHGKLKFIRIGGFTISDFIPALQIDKLRVPSISSSLNFTKHQNYFDIIPSDGQQYFDIQISQVLLGQLHRIFDEIMIIKCQIGVTQQNFNIIKNKLKSHPSYQKVLGYKLYLIRQQKIAAGSLVIFCIQEDFHIIKNLYNWLFDSIEQHMMKQSVLFSLGNFLRNNQLGYGYQQKIISFFIKRCHKDFQMIAKQCQIEIQEITHCIMRHKKKSLDYITDESDLDNKSPPKYSINLIISGNKNKFYELFLELQKYVSDIPLTIFQINQPLYQLTKQQETILKNQNIMKLDTTNYLLLGTNQQQNDIKKILNNRQWCRQLDRQEAQILSLEHANHNLQRYMKSKFIQFENIKIENQQLIVVTDRKNWQLFDRNLNFYLDSYENITSQCYGFQKTIIRKIFMKYFQHQIKSKFDVTFFINHDNGCLYRSTYKKNVDYVDSQMKDILEKIHKNCVKFRINRPVNQQKIKQYQLEGLYQQREVQQKVVNQSILGFKIYRMGNVNIRARPFNSIKRQQKIIIFLLDNCLHNSSEFYNICQESSIDYEAFVTKALAPKKPDRLRKYLTPQFAIAESVILFFLGLRGKTQTYQRDIENLLSDQGNRVSIALMKHDNLFLSDNLPMILKNIKQHAKENYLEQGYTLDLYYEGGENQLISLESTLRHSSMNIRPNGKCLQSQDILEIIMDNQTYIHLKDTSIKLSLLQSYILHTQQNKRSIINFPSTSQNTNITQYFINLKQSTVYHIYKNKEVQQLQIDEQVHKNLILYIQTIKKYLSSLNYATLIAKVQNVDNDNENKQIEFYQNFYLAKDGQMMGIDIDLKQKVIKQKKNQKIKYQKLQVTQAKYEIETFDQELDSIRKCIQ